MTISEQEHQFETYISRCKDMMLRKGSDYANADRLSSFKLSGAIIGQSAEQSCLNHIATKVSRLGQLIGSGKTAQNESLADTVLDLTCYSILLNMILNEKIPTASPVLIYSGKLSYPESTEDSDG